MERHVHHKDLEKLLKENADQYRMYPSDKVWENIHSTLHTRPRSYGYFTAALLLFSAALISLLLMKTTAEKNSLAVVNTSHTASQQINLPQTPVQKVLSRPLQLSTIPSSQQLTTKSRRISAGKKETSLTEAPKATTQPLEMVPVSATNELLTKNAINISEDNVLPMERSKDDNPANPDLIFPKTSIRPDDLQVSEGINALGSLNMPAVLSGKHSRWSSRFYFTPTISYRKLTENKRPYSNGYYSYSQIISLNNLVQHKPAMGLEFGVEEKYRTNNNLFLKAGFQFNINRYDIRAYPHPTEIATIAINSGPVTSYVATLSNYRNFSGTYANWLENFYFQAAFPVGAEIILGSKKNLNWGISGTLQPTYVIGDRAYLISSDYKNYAKFPDLMRRWNLSSGLETFVTYSTGKVSWQAGPHLRYQHLSSYVSGYPVKENLFAVGLKIGATLQSGKK